jgi:hypothetical protein
MLIRLAYLPEVLPSVGSSGFSSCKFWIVWATKSLRCPLCGVLIPTPACSHSGLQKGFMVNTLVDNPEPTKTESMRVGMRTPTPACSHIPLQKGFVVNTLVDDPKLTIGESIRVKVFWMFLATKSLFSLLCGVLTPTPACCHSGKVSWSTHSWTIHDLQLNNP